MSKCKNLFLLFTLFIFTGLSFNSYAGPVCGNNVVEPPEECDTGTGATSLCNNDTDPAGGNGPCMFTICGDSILQSPNGVGFNEECEPPNVAGVCDAICQTVTTTTTTTTTSTTGATTSTTGATTSTTGATTSTTGATTSTTGATTSTTGATTSTTGATTSTTGGGTTTTTTASTTTTAAATTTTTQVPAPPSVTVPLIGGAGTVTIITATGDTISAVSTGTALTSTAPSNVSFPYGTISYTTTSPVGGSVTMTFEFSTNLPDNLVLYKVDANDVYTELPASVWTKTGARTLEVTVTDGDPVTDQDGLVNGSIEDPLAVGGENGGGGGCTISKTSSAGMDPIWLFLLLAPGLGILRRRATATGVRRTNSI